MRNLISVAVIVHVAITVAGLELNGVEVKFGDMIAYPPSCGAISVQHFAIYVGDQYPGQGNIFERLKDTETLNPTCIFSDLSHDEKPFVFNFLDGYTDSKGKTYTKSADNIIKQRIAEKHAKCGLYNALGNNCEHLATYVRYGEKISLQFNLTGERLCLSNKAKDMVKYVKACQLNN